MTCTTCEERRRKLLDALWDLKMAEAIKQVALGAKEIISGPIR